MEFLRVGPQRNSLFIPFYRGHQMVLFIRPNSLRPQLCIIQVERSWHSHSVRLLSNSPAIHFLSGIKSQAILRILLDFRSPRMAYWLIGWGQVNRHCKRLGMTGRERCWKPWEHRATIGDLTCRPTRDESPSIATMGQEATSGSSRPVPDRHPVSHSIRLKRTRRRFGLQTERGSRLPLSATESGVFT